MMIGLIGTYDRRWYLHQELVEKKKLNLDIMSFFFQFGFLICLPNSFYPVILVG